jgi:hypothetical protein
MRQLVSKIRIDGKDYNLKDKFQFTNDRCKTLFPDATLAANDPNAGISSTGPYCTGFRNVGYSDVKPRYGDKYPEAVKQFKSLFECVKDYRIKIDKVKKEFRSQDGNPRVLKNSENLIKAIVEGINNRFIADSNKSDLSVIENVMKNSLTFSGDMKKGITGILDCTILKKKLHHLKDSVCMPGNFADTFASLSFYLLIMGPFLVLLGICMCCQIRLADRDKHKMPSHMKKRQ